LCRACNCQKSSKRLKDLHPEIRGPLIEAADAFYFHWHGGQHK